MTNKAFWRALNSLAHPLTILAAVTLLLNDHWLRWELPSWWTGKLGDFAWLVFAPFLCALLLAWLIPQRWRQQERFVGVASIAFIGAWFALAKTVPIIHTLTVNVLDSIVGWQGGLRMDATDLLTLPALFISWHIWRSVHNTAPRVPLGYVVTALGLMGTLATSCTPPDLGIVALCREGDTVVAMAGSFGTLSYVSNDDGLTWSQESRNRCSDNFYSRSTITGTFGPYQIIEDDGVYRSGTRILDLSPYQHDSYAMVHEAGQTGFLCGDPKQYLPGPRSVVYDEQTGYLLLAMSLDGVLLNTGDDNWQWITVGGYQHLTIEEPTTILTTLKIELILAFGLLMLAPMTLALPANNLRCQEITVLTIGWGTWLLALTFNRSGFDNLIILFIGIPLVIISIIWTTWGKNPVIFQRRSFGANLMLIVLTLGVVTLYLLPYALWVRRTVPNHGAASTFAFLLVGGAMFTAVPYFHWRFPPRKKKKHPDDDDEPLPPPIEHMDTYIVEDDAE